MIVRWSLLFLILTLGTQAQTGVWTRADQVNPLGIKNLFVLDDSAMYVVSSNGLFRSRDGGMFWREIYAAPAPPDYISSIVPDPASGRASMVMNVYFRYEGKGTSGVFRSTDGGKTWGYLGGPVGNWGGYACTAGDQGVFMLCSPDGIVHLDIFGTARKYVDGLPGNWSGIATFSSGAALLYTPTNKGYLSGSGLQPWRTPWRSMDIGTSGEEIRYVHAEGNQAWAAMSSTGIRRASYPGFQWAHVNNGLGAPGDPSMHVRRIFRDKRGPLVALTYGGLYSSADGDNWSPVQNTLPDSGRLVAAAVDFEGRYGMLYGRDSILVSEDEARTWELRSSGLAMDSIRDILVLGDDVFAADNHCLFRLHGWSYGTRYWRQHIEGLTDFRIRTLVATRDSEVFAFSLAGHVFGLPRGGASWQSLSVDLTGETVTAAASSSGGLLLAGTERGAVAVSRDGGVVWEYGTRPITSAPVRCVFAVTDSLLYAGTFGEGLQRSTDAGATWARVSSGLAHPNITALLQTPDGDLYAGSYGMGVYRSTDLGFSWAPTIAASPGQYVTAMVTNSIGVLAVATYDQGVCTSRRDGTDWTVHTAPQPGLRFVRLRYDPRLNYFYGLTAKGELYGGYAGLATAVEARPAPARFALHSVYPIPFRDRIDVTFSMQVPGSMRITVSDLLGREIMVQEEIVSETGPCHRVLSAGSLSPGAYLLKLESGGERETKILTHIR